MFFFCFFLFIFLCFLLESRNRIATWLLSAFGCRFCRLTGEQTLLTAVAIPLPSDDNPKPPQLFGAQCPQRTSIEIIYGRCWTLFRRRPGTRTTIISRRGGRSDLASTMHRPTICFSSRRGNTAAVHATTVRNRTVRRQKHSLYQRRRQREIATKSSSIFCLCNTRAACATDLQLYLLSFRG